MNAIGGYLGLELNKGVHQYHDTEYQTMSGRASLTLILEYLKPERVHIPLYTCATLLEPFKNLNIYYTFYKITPGFEPEHIPDLKAGEYFLYINYFDLKRSTVQRLSEKYKERLIVDCTQAFFMKGNGTSWFFNSCRKFFGVPDGSYLYVPDGIKLIMPAERNEAYETAHLVNRFNGHAQEGYEYFLKNEELIGNRVSGMAVLTEYLLSHINYNEAANVRRANYNYLYSWFKDLNRLDSPLEENNVPICFPFLTDNTVSKSQLFSENIYIPTFWKEVQEGNKDEFPFETWFAEKLWPLPIDQRYRIDDLAVLCTSLKRIL